MVKVKGNSRASAMVAVRPGSAPTKRPPVTPRKMVRSICGCRMLTRPCRIISMAVRDQAERASDVGRVRRPAPKSTRLLSLQQAAIGIEHGLGHLDGFLACVIGHHEADRLLLIANAFIGFSEGLGQLLDDLRRRARRYRKDRKSAVEAQSACRS